MKVSISATVEKVCPIQRFGEGTFFKQELILNMEPNGKYENVVAITFIKSDTDKLKTIKDGQQVTVECYIQGRSYLKEGRPESERRYFNELRGFSITSLEVLQPDDIKDNTPEEDDLPF